MVRSVLPVALAVVVAAACSPRIDGDARVTRLNEAKRSGAALVEAGEFTAAIELLEPLANEASGDSQVLLLLGDALAGAGREADAVRSYEQAIRLTYTDYEAHLKLATVLMRLEKTGRALTEFEIAVEYGKEEPLVHYNYGLALHDLGQVEEALRHWRIARRLDPTDARFAAAVGMALVRSNPQAALRAFESAESLGAAGAAFDNNYGLALQELGRLEDARSRFRSAVEGAPDEEAYRFNLAALEMRAGRWDAAVLEWTGMLERFGERWSYRVYLARALVEKGKYEEAIASLADLAADVEEGRVADGDPVMDRVPPGLDEALAILALAHRGRGELETALAYMRRAVALDPENVSHLNNYGVVLAESGMLPEARAQWRRVLELDAKNATARENLSAFEP